MNIIVLHVLAGARGLGEHRKARIGKFSTDLTAAHPEQIRMACKPENFASTGFFHSCRTPHDSNAPHPGGSEENGIGICESLSQRSNYSEIIRLARRNHKPGGADLAGSVHVVRSLSG